MKFISSVFLWARRLIVCALVLFLILGVVAYLLKLSEQPPGVKNAPWVIQTYSQDSMRLPARIYYAGDIEIVGNTPVIKPYWSYDGKRFHKHKEAKAFPVDTYGNVGIIRRVKQ